jgi:diaminopimelate epimerase
MYSALSAQANPATIRNMIDGRQFVKMQGLRNHFVIVDAREQSYAPTMGEVVNICDVQVGVGADQLVVIEPPTEAGRAGGACAFVRFFNIDGPEAEACGNATRCAAWLLLEENGDQSLQIETRNGVLPCKRAGAQQVSCGMGAVTMDWRRIPTAEECDTSHLGIDSGPLADPVAVGVGNPHVVFFVADLDTIDLQRYAPAIQNHSLFPNQVNVGAAQIVRDDYMRLSVYERGAGLTTACGSGACAAVFAALARGLTAKRAMTVAMPAGEVQIDISPDDFATMTGPVAYSFAGRLP